MDHDNLLEGRINDLSERAYSNDYLTYTHFLSEGDLAVFHSMLINSGISRHSNVYNGSRYIIYGGHPDSDRNIICFLPGYITEEDFLSSEPLTGDIIKCLHIVPLNQKFADTLSHRDFLGALMNMGIERDQIGDILVKESDAFVFVLSEIAGIIARELSKVRHTSVKCDIVSPSLCTIEPKFTEISGSVASERLDAIVSMVFHISRGKAQDLIRAESVFVNGRTVTSVSSGLNPNDKISVRGYGKFIFDGMGNVTKKGRIYANVKVYS
ncbi:YlmH/Sll1252 family protein [Oribacterium sp. P6A1]|uniref:YlmH/Sll1252 family protein n=1 Tax=Oribacterium sp. P6A1 TaxID=1410612 RepID=UPI00055B26D9|nr:YlmH/Sll1252 family protein [Oribacterium sp. P6A1]